MLKTHNFHFILPFYFILKYYIILNCIFLYLFHKEIIFFIFYDNVFIEVIENVIGECIKNLRKSHKLTQAELSDILNIGQSTLANFENGKRTIPTDIIIKLAQYFNVTTDYLLGISSEPTTNSINYTHLNNDELQLLNTYRSLSPDARQVVLGKALDLKISAINTQTFKKDIG